MRAAPAAITRRRTFITDREPASRVHRDGHLGTALLVYAPLGHVLAWAGEHRLALAGAVVAMECCRLPDVDDRVRGLAHRGVTHTMAFAAAAGTVAGAVARAAVLAGLHTPVAWRPGWTGPGDVVGILGFAVVTASLLAHVGADALTPMDVPLLWPISGRRYGIGVVTADAPLAKHVLFVAGVAATLTWLTPLRGALH